MFVARGRSAWKSQGSEMKRKSGDSVMQIFRRLKEVRLKPSQFQVRHLNLLVLFTGASEWLSDLSGDISLNIHHELHYQECR